MGMLRYVNVSKFLLLLLLVVDADGFGRPRSYRHHRKSSGTMKNCILSNLSEITPSTEKPKKTTTIMDHDPYYDCGLVGFGVVQKILYETPTSGYSPIDVDLSSVCVKCGMCLVIAQKINETLIDVHDSMPSNQWLKDDEANVLLKATCNDQFRHYALREINGERYIGDSLPGAILVVTTVDGNWENILRKKCYEVLDKVGARDLYKHWRDWCEKSSSELADFLCRSESGELRDCHSIVGDGRRPENCHNFYSTGIKVVAEFG